VVGQGPGGAEPPGPYALRLVRQLGDPRLLLPRQGEDVGDPERAGDSAAEDGSDDGPAAPDDDVDDEPVARRSNLGLLQECALVTDPPRGGEPVITVRTRIDDCQRTMGYRSP